MRMRVRVSVRARGCVLIEIGYADGESQRSIGDADGAPESSMHAFALHSTRGQVPV
jgi:hypothetical protein